MFDFFVSNFKKGLIKIKENPQLSYTLLVAVVIFLSFLFVSNNFISVAKNAQEKLINVRIGSVQDVFSEFAYEYLEEPEKLSQKIKTISQKNETIEKFAVYGLEEDGLVVISSLDEEQVGKKVEDDFLYDLATIDPNHSVTKEEIIEGERFFRTARAIVDDKGEIVGIIGSKQTLSHADQIIENEIRSSIFVLIVVILLVMFLFLRHAKIIDYAGLYKRIKQINQMKDEFISMVSHELRTPLTVIRGYADILRGAKTDKERQKYFENINSQVDRLNTLIEDISDTSRIEQGRLTLDLKPINSEKIIKEVVSSLEHNAKEKDLDLYIEKGEYGTIIVDENRLKQILTNLIGNAIKYTKKGEVKVRVSNEKKNLLIEIIDTGIGMTFEQQKQLFKKFYRVKSKETAKVSGTGLGLWITKKLIEMMKGEVSIESMKGTGTQVFIKFPLKEK